MDQIFVDNRNFYTLPALDAAVNFNSSENIRQRHTISDGDVALEQGTGGVAHSFNSTPRSSNMRLADALVSYFGFRFTKAYN